MSGTPEASRSSPGPSSNPSPNLNLPKRRSVEEDSGITDADLPQDLPEKDLELLRFNLEVDAEIDNLRSVAEASTSAQRSPPPQYPASEASASSSTFRSPPPFSSLFATLDPELAASVLEPLEPYKYAVTDDVDETPSSAPAYAPSFDQLVNEPSNSASSAASQFQDETKRALPQDTKGESSKNKDDDAEPPPAYSEGSSPLLSFTYLMAAAGGASSIITQVQQGGPPISTLGGMYGLIGTDICGTAR